LNFIAAGCAAGRIQSERLFQIYDGRRIVRLAGVREADQRVGLGRPRIEFQVHVEWRRRACLALRAGHAAMAGYAFHLRCLLNFGIEIASHRQHCAGDVFLRLRLTFAARRRMTVLAAYANVPVHFM